MLVKHPLHDVWFDKTGNVYRNGNVVVFTGKPRYRSLTLQYQGKAIQVSVHRLMVEAFTGKIPKGLQVNHIDGNRYNNSILNLEVVTGSENCKHAVRIGLSDGMKGEAHFNSKLTERQVLDLYKDIKLFKSNNELALKYSIPFRLVSLIRNGKRWEHLFKVHLKEVIPSLNFKNFSLAEAVEIVDSCEYLTNTEISKNFNIEASLVSRVRSRSTWLEFFNYEGRIREVVKAQIEQNKIII